MHIFISAKATNIVKLDEGSLKDAANDVREAPLSSSLTIISRKKNAK